MSWRRYHKNLAARRLYLEQQAMRQEHPSFKLQQDDDGSLSWIGSIKTKFGRVYKIRISYSRNYPLSEFEIYVLSPRIQSSYLLHGQKGMRLCQYIKAGMWNPERSTPVASVRQAAEFLHRYDRRCLKRISFNAPL